MNLFLPFWGLVTKFFLGAAALITAKHAIDWLLGEAKAKGK